MSVLEKDWETIKEMLDSGGSFVKKLAELMHYADQINYEKLKNTFPEYFEQYRKMAEKSKNKLK